MQGASGLFVTVLVLGLSAISLGGAGPPWAGQAGSTQLRHHFSTPALRPTPEVVLNAFGNPGTLITVNEPFGTGWQNPALPFRTSGVEEDGAWDIGPGGSVVIDLPVAPEANDPGLIYRVEVFLHLVAYQTPVALPEISFPGLSLEAVSSSQAVLKQETIGRYVGLTWRAEADLPAGVRTLQLRLSGTAQGAVIDSVEMHTRHFRKGTWTHTYGSWLERHYAGESDPGRIGFTSAPFGDGVANGLKYYLGQPPQALASVLRRVAVSPRSVVFVHTRNRRLPADLEARYEWSLDLRNWHGHAVSSHGTSVGFSAVTVPTAHEDHDDVQVTASVLEGNPGAFFVRLSVHLWQP